MCRYFRVHLFRFRVGSTETVEQYLEDDKGNFWLDVQNTAKNSSLSWSTLYGNVAKELVLNYPWDSEVCRRITPQMMPHEAEKILYQNKAAVKVLHFQGNDGKDHFLFLARQNAIRSDKKQLIEKITINDELMEKTTQKRYGNLSDIGRFYQISNGVTLNDVTTAFLPLVLQNIGQSMRLGSRKKEEGLPISQFLIKRPKEAAYLSPSKILKPHKRTLISEYAYFKNKGEWTFTNYPESLWEEKDVVIVFVRTNKPDVYESVYKTAGKPKNAKLFWWNWGGFRQGTPVEYFAAKKEVERRALAVHQEAEAEYQEDKKPSPLQNVVKRLQGQIAEENDPFEQARKELLLESALRAVVVINLH